MRIRNCQSLSHIFVKQTKNKKWCFKCKKKKKQNQQQPKTFSLDGVLRGYLVLPKDLWFGAEVPRPLHLCPHHDCHLSCVLLICFCTLYICSQPKATFYIIITPWLNFLQVLCVHAKLLWSCLILLDPVDCSLPGSSVHGTFQAGILELAAIPSSRGSSQPRDWTHISYVSYTSKQGLYHKHHLGTQPQI